MNAAEQPPIEAAAAPVLDWLKTLTQKEDAVRESRRKEEVSAARVLIEPRLKEAREIADAVDDARRENLAWIESLLEIDFAALRKNVPITIVRGSDIDTG